MHFQFDVLGDVMFPDLRWFQDGAGYHRHAGVTARLTALFGANVVALGRQVEWPARSPGLTPCDFFLWGYLKSRVYKTPPENIFAPRQWIINEFNLLAQTNYVGNAMAAMLTKAELCIERNGRHVEGTV